jgi:hypothetical protein|tara:strand:- start:304 stop:456 length:153 start_codon:yes stop_codon:yes gene_type:complete
MTNTLGEKELRTKWAFTSGLVAGTTRQAGRQSNLVPTRGSLVPRRKKVGL